MKIEYIENDINKGIKYDYNLIRKEFKKLKCPKTVYNPCKIPFHQSAYQILLSERSTGKTTNILLFGMCMNKLYGTILQYIRVKEDMISNKTINELFKTIRQYDYVSKLTDGKYNNVTYKARKWYYCNVGEDGKIIDIAPEHFMFCLSVDRNEEYKSSYNAPLGDFIIFDEFIGKYYRMNEFVYFMDLLKTIIRDRESTKILMLANTINRHSEYFSEFEIYDELQIIENGQSEIINTDGGTSIYIELIEDRKETTQKKKINQLFFGFNNPLLNSIKGGSWATKEYPHIERGYAKLWNGIYIIYHNKILALDIVRYDDIGICINCHLAHRTYDDSIIYSIDEPKNQNYRYYFGKGDKLDTFIMSLIKTKHIRFANNSVGTLFTNYYNQKDVNKYL